MNSPKPLLVKHNPAGHYESLHKEFTKTSWSRCRGLIYGSMGRELINKHEEVSATMKLTITSKTEETLLSELREQRPLSRCSCKSGITVDTRFCLGLRKVILRSLYKSCWIVVTCPPLKKVILFLWPAHAACILEQCAFFSFANEILT